MRIIQATWHAKKLFPVAIVEALVVLCIDVRVVAYSICVVEGCEILLIGDEVVILPVSVVVECCEILLIDDGVVILSASIVVEYYEILLINDGVVIRSVGIDIVLEACGVLGNDDRVAIYPVRIEVVDLGDVVGDARFGNRGPMLNIWREKLLGLVSSRDLGRLSWIEAVLRVL